MIQNVVWSVSIVLMGCLALVFIWVAAGARFAIANYGPAIDAAYRMRVWLFGLALAVLIGTNFQTLDSRRMSIRNFEGVLRPKSVALIGASNRANSAGLVTMENLLSGGLAESRN